MGYKDHMYALSSKSGSEPFRFALFLGDLRWNDPVLLLADRWAILGITDEQDREERKPSIL